MDRKFSNGRTAATDILYLVSRRVKVRAVQEFFAGCAAAAGSVDAPPDRRWARGRRIQPIEKEQVDFREHAGDPFFLRGKMPPTESHRLQIVAVSSGNTAFLHDLVTPLGIEQIVFAIAHCPLSMAPHSQRAGASRLETCKMSWQSTSVGGPPVTH
jgi:hypothetical protein